MLRGKSNAIVLGLAASLFFSITFIINRKLSLGGGSWVWNAALRFYWMLPFFAIIVLLRKNLWPLIVELIRNPTQWLIWSTVGFGLFYAPLTYAAAYGPSWLIAGTWQITIIAGLILSPFISSDKKKKARTLASSFIFSGIILSGIVIAQISQAESVSIKTVLSGVLPVVIAAFAYPLGNRKLMQLVNGRLDVYQRIFGMLICSMPFWMLLSLYHLARGQELPEAGQYVQTLIVAITAGVIATALFFSATDKAYGNEQTLAAVEATQSAEVVFALIGEVVLLQTGLPHIYSITGIAFVILGMLLHAFYGQKL